MFNLDREDSALNLNSREAANRFDCSFYQNCTFPTKAI